MNYLYEEGNWRLQERLKLPSPQSVNCGEGEKGKKDECCDLPWR